MKSISVLLATMAFVLLSMTSCYYDVEEELYPTSSCDTTNVLFSGDVTAVLDAKCLTCHKATNAGSIGGGINLEGYDNLKVYVDNGKFLSSINHDGGASFMPKSANNTKLPECDILKITTWVNAGALNN